LPMESPIKGDLFFPDLSPRLIHSDTGSAVI
jgi:hypothetical protein